MLARTSALLWKSKKGEEIKIQLLRWRMEGRGEGGGGAGAGPYLIYRIRLVAGRVSRSEGVSGCEAK